LELCFLLFFTTASICPRTFMIASTQVPHIVARIETPASSFWHISYMVQVVCVCHNYVTSGSTYSSPFSTISYLNHISSQYLHSSCFFSTCHLYFGDPCHLNLYGIWTSMTPLFPCIDWSSPPSQWESIWLDCAPPYIWSPTIFQCLLSNSSISGWI
jgi:hypothetical protein